MNLYEKHPSLSPDTFVAPNASVIGNVLCGRKTVIWYGAVVRGKISLLCTISDCLSHGLWFDLLCRCSFAFSHSTLPIIPNHWFFTHWDTIAADLNNITIGDYSTVGDRAVIHTSKSVEGKQDAACDIGRHVQIGKWK